MRRLRVLVLLHPDLMPPDSLKGYSEKEIHVWKTEYDVVTTLRALGHDVKPLGVQHELKPIRDAVAAALSDGADGVGIRELLTEWVEKQNLPMG